MSKRDFLLHGYQKAWFLASSRISDTFSVANPGAFPRRGIFLTEDEEYRQSSFVF